MKKYSIELDETFLDYPDPEGTAIIFFLSGCSHHCVGCQNLELQEPVEYTETPEELCKRIVDFSKRCCTNKIVISGGDPLSKNNIEYTKNILQILGDSFDICIYTGYTIDAIKNMKIQGYKYIKCGKFDIKNKQESYKNDDYMQFVNKTQNLYDNKYKQLSVDGRFYFKKQNKAMEQ